MHGNDIYKNEIFLDSYSDWLSFDEETFIEEFNNVQWVNVLKLEKRDPEETPFNGFYESLDSSIKKTCSSKNDYQKAIEIYRKTLGS